jgi:hypothetical protein
MFASTFKGNKPSLELKDLLIIFRSSFSIFHLERGTIEDHKIWKMENQKWKMTNKSLVPLNIFHIALTISLVHS